MQFEDVGGNDDIDDETLMEPEHMDTLARSEQMYECADVVKLLCRQEEIATTTKSRKHTVAHVRMRDCAKTFSSVLKGVADNRALKRDNNVCFRAESSQLLRIQAAKAQAMRKHSNDDSDVALDVRCPALLLSEPAVTAFSIEEIRQGPAALCWKLARKAQLNKDQLRAVSLLADVMQQEFDRMLKENPELANAGADIWAKNAY